MPSSTDRPFGHMVFFTLRDSSPEARQRLVVDCQKYLSDHPGTVHFSAGQISDACREVNDREFHVALHVVFDSRAAHDAYQTADRHQQFIDANRDNWSQVRVFDSVIGT